MTVDMQTLESYFYEEGGLQRVLPALKSELERADYFNSMMIDNITDNAEECKRASNEIDGLYGRLFKAWAFADGALDVMEPRIKARIKKEARENKEKLTDGAVAAQAADEVSMYRRVRAYLYGYTETLNKSLFTLASILKYESSPKGVAKSQQTYNNDDQQEP